MSSYKNIVQSITEPTNKNDLWLKKDGLYKFGQNGWEPVTKIDIPDPAPSYTVLKESYIGDVLSEDLELLDSLFYNLDTPLFVEIGENYGEDGYSKATFYPAKIVRKDYGSGGQYKYNIIADLVDYYKYYCITPDNPGKVEAYMRPKTNTYDEIKVEDSGSTLTDEISVYYLGEFNSFNPETISSTIPDYYSNLDDNSLSFYVSNENNSLHSILFKVRSEIDYANDTKNLYLYKDSVSAENYLNSMSLLNEHNAIYISNAIPFSNIKGAKTIYISNKYIQDTESVKSTKTKVS